MKTSPTPQETAAALAKVTITVKSAADIPGSSKCPRCWHWHTVQGNYDDLCDRCCKILVTNFPDHPSVPHIKTALEKWTQ